LIVVVLFSACSSGSGGPDNPEPINTIESQIVGKTFWRVLEGTHEATYTDSWVKESNGYTSVDANGYTRAIVEYTTDIPNCSDLQIYEY